MGYARIVCEGVWLDIALGGPWVIDRIYVGKDNNGDEEVHVERSLTVRAMSSVEHRNAKKATSIWLSIA